MAKERGSNVVCGFTLGNVQRNALPMFREQEDNSRKIAWGVCWPHQTRSRRTLNQNVDGILQIYSVLLDCSLCDDKEKKCHEAVFHCCDLEFPHTTCHFAKANKHETYRRTPRSGLLLSRKHFMSCLLSSCTDEKQPVHCITHPVRRGPTELPFSALRLLEV
eukprot:3515235-Rhodomonas_salina.1